jgi:hypothetical protein
MVEKRRHRVNIMVDLDTWHEFQKMARTMGLSASRFVEILVKSQLTGRSGSVDQVIRGLYGDFIEGQQGVSKKEKEQQVGELFKDDR